MTVCTVYVVVLRLQVFIRSGRKRRRRKEAPSIPRTTDRGPDWDDANTLVLWSGALMDGCKLSVTLTNPFG